MVETLDTWIRTVGPLGYLVLFGAALIEYVFPPFPGDTVVLLGGVYAIRGDRPWLLVLLVVTAGSVVGSAIDYVIGQRLARRFEHGEEFARKHPHLIRLQERMRERGIVLIAFNRFLPGVRGLLFAAAGAAEMSFRRVMLWGAFSALLWNSLILGIGIAVGGNAERLGGLLQRYNRFSWIVLAVVFAAVAIRYVWRLRSRPQEP
ncbi:MAG: DedA family protein [Myxococcaceae bacterium]